MTPRQTWLSGRALALHLTVVVVVVTFCLLARWQVHRALSGNELSWAYAFEWPFFALYAIYMWWKLLHDEDGDRPTRRRDQTEAEAEALEEYNRYLARLAERDRSAGNGHAGSSAGNGHAGSSAGNRDSAGEVDGLQEAPVVGHE